MAVRIPIGDLNERDRFYLEKTLNTDEGEFFSIEGDDVYVPFAFAHAAFDLRDDDVVVGGGVERKKIEFVGTLRPEQAEMTSRCEETLRANRGHLVIYPHTGFGKTVMTLRLICDFSGGGGKTCILTNRVMLLEQWKTAVAEFTTAKCAILDPRDEDDRIADDVDVVIANPVNVRKKSRSYWRDVKLLVADEVHQLVTREASKAFFAFTPDKVVALSATPYRFDEYDAAIGWFFGKAMIGKELRRHHVVDYVETGFVPEIKYTANGIDWNSVLTSQALDEARNRKIVDIVTRSVREDGRVWMILVKRVAQASILARSFADDVRCATLIGAQKTFDERCDVLIGTTSKIGVGFDHKPIDSLCIAADVKNYFVQFLGRCMRRVDATPYVVDLVDDFKPLRRHFADRCAEYRRYGGVVKKFNEER